MQKYRPQKPLAALADKILRLLIACGAGVGWFVYLWGVSIAALAAGIALGGLLWLCARQFGKRITQKREMQMRRILGGELALEQLLLYPAKQAGFQAALWLAPRFPLMMNKAVDWGVTGTLDNSPTLIRLIAQHPGIPVNVQQMVDVAREMQQYNVKRCIVCSTSALEKEALSFAAQFDPSMLIIPRDELIQLAGMHSPATDEQLRMLGRKKRMRRTLNEWIAIILAPNRARRYLGYGLGLSLLALLTGHFFYPLPAAACLLLFALCKYRSFRQRAQPM